ncbi:MAG: CBS domain-containing protein [Rhodospirillales bacterium]|nr:CBS domain-containing protein [Rhodospirillales bacterium]
MNHITQTPPLAGRVATLGDLAALSRFASFRPEEMLGDALEKMQEHGLRAAGVVNATGQFSGLISAETVIRTLLRQTEPSRRSYPLPHNNIGFLTVWEATRPAVHTAAPSMTIEQALDMMLEYNIAYMPVLDQGKLIAIVDVSTLALQTRHNLHRDLKRKNEQIQYLSAQNAEHGDYPIT